MSKSLASELAPRVSTKLYGALIVRNHPVEIEPVHRQLDARLFFCFCPPPLLFFNLTSIRFARPPTSVFDLVFLFISRSQLGLFSHFTLCVLVLPVVRMLECNLEVIQTVLTVISG